MGGRSELAVTGTGVVAGERLLVGAEKLVVRDGLLPGCETDRSRPWSEPVLIGPCEGNGARTVVALVPGAARVGDVEEDVLTLLVTCVTGTVLGSVEAVWYLLLRWKIVPSIVVGLTNWPLVKDPFCTLIVR